jgi:hypothetical protein
VRRRTGEEEETADTEVKTKTPHVNVGKNKETQYMDDSRI